MQKTEFIHSNNNVAINFKQLPIKSNTLTVMIEPHAKTDV